MSGEDLGINDKEFLNLTYLNEQYSSEMLDYIADSLRTDIPKILEELAYVRVADQGVTDPELLANLTTKVNLMLEAIEKSKQDSVENYKTQLETVRFDIALAWHEYQVDKFRYDYLDQDIAGLKEALHSDVSRWKLQLSGDLSDEEVAFLYVEFNEAIEVLGSRGSAEVDEELQSVKALAASLRPLEGKRRVRSVAERYISLNHDEILSNLTLDVERISGERKLLEGETLRVLIPEIAALSEINIDSFEGEKAKSADAEHAALREKHQEISDALLGISIATNLGIANSVLDEFEALLEAGGMPSKEQVEKVRETASTVGQILERGEVLGDVALLSLRAKQLLNNIQPEAMVSKVEGAVADLADADELATTEAHKAFEACMEETNKILLGSDQEFENVLEASEALMKHLESDLLALEMYEKGQAALAEMQKLLMDPSFGMLEKVKALMTADFDDKDFNAKNLLAIFQDEHLVRVNTVLGEVGPVNSALAGYRLMFESEHEALRDFNKEVDEKEDFYEKVSRLTHAVRRGAVLQASCDYDPRGEMSEINTLLGTAKNALSKALSEFLGEFDVKWDSESFDGRIGSDKIALISREIQKCDIVNRAYQLVDAHRQVDATQTGHTSVMKHRDRLLGQIDLEEALSARFKTLDEKGLGTFGEMIEKLPKAARSPWAVKVLPVAISAIEKGCYQNFNQVRALIAHVGEDAKEEWTDKFQAVRDAAIARQVEVLGLELPATPNKGTDEKASHDAGYDSADVSPARERKKSWIPWRKNTSTAKVATVLRGMEAQRKSDDLPEENEASV